MSILLFVLFFFFNIFFSRVCAQSNEIFWPLPLDSLIPTDPVTNSIVLSDISCATLTITDLFPETGLNLIVKNATITNVVKFHSNFTLRNASISFVDTQLRIFGQDANLTLLEGSTLEFIRCLIIPKEENQKDFNVPHNFALGIQLVIHWRSKDYKIVLRNSTYRFVSEGSFFLQAKEMPIAFSVNLVRVTDLSAGERTAFFPPKFQFEMFNYTFREIHVCDNKFEANHGAMSFFRMLFWKDTFTESDIVEGFFFGRHVQVTGGLLNISNNVIQLRQIEPTNTIISTSRNIHYSLFGPRIYATLQLQQMILDDNKIDARNFSIRRGGEFSVFFHGTVPLNGLVGMRVLSIQRNDIVMSPRFDAALFKMGPQATLPNINFVKGAQFYGLQNISEILFVNNKFFITTAANGYCSYFSLSGVSHFNNTGIPVNGTNIGRILINSNTIVFQDVILARGLSMNADVSNSYLRLIQTSFNNITIFLDQKNSNWTSWFDGEFQGLACSGIQLQGEAEGYLSRVENISMTDNNIDIRGAPQITGMTNLIHSQDTDFIEFARNKLIAIQDDRTDRPLSVASASDHKFASYCLGIRVSMATLRIEKVEIRENDVFVSCKTGCGDLNAVETTNFFDSRLLKSDSLLPQNILPSFRDRPQLIYRNVSIFNNILKVLKNGTLGIEALATGIKVGNIKPNEDPGYFYISNNSISVMTTATSPASGVCGVAVTSIGWTRNFSMAMIWNNSIRVSGVAKLAGGVLCQSAGDVDTTNVMQAQLTFFPSDNFNFKNLIVENNIIKVSSLKGTAACFYALGAGAIEIVNMTLRGNVVLLTSKPFIESFGTEFSIAQTYLATTIDLTKVTPFVQDQISYFYITNPYGSFDFVNLIPGPGFSMNVLNLIIENEIITLEKSGSFFSTRVGFYIAGRFLVNNINFQSSGIAEYSSTYRSASISTTFNIDPSIAANADLNYFDDTIIPRISFLNVTNSNFRISSLLLCSKVLSSSRNVINQQIGFMNILPSSTGKSVLGQISVSNSSFTQDCSSTSSSSTSNNNIIFILPPSTSASISTVINISKFKVISLSNENFFSPKNGILLDSSSTTTSSTGSTKLTIDCSTWNDRSVSKRSSSIAKAALKFVSSPSLLSIGCKGDGVSTTQSKSSVRTESERTKNSQTLTEQSPTVSSHQLPRDVYDLASMEKTVIASQVLALAGFDGALALSSARGMVLVRLANCYVNQKDLTEGQKFIKFSNFSAHAISSEVKFPRSLVPGGSIGAAAGGQFRCGIAICIVLFVASVVLCMYHGVFKRDEWKKYHAGQIRAKNQLHLRTIGAQYDDGVGPFWKHAQIDKFILIPLNFYISGWSELAGGLTSGSDAKDGVFALLPIVAICLFCLGVMSALYNFSSESENEKLKSPQNDREEALLGQKYQQKSRPRKRSSSSSSKIEITPYIRNGDGENFPLKIIPKNFVEASDAYIPHNADDIKTTRREKFAYYFTTNLGRFFFVGSNCRDLGNLLWIEGSEDRENRHWLPHQLGMVTILPIAGLRYQFMTYLEQYLGPMKITKQTDDHRDRSSKNNHRFSSSSRTNQHSGNNNNKINKVEFDFSLRTRMQILWPLLSLLVTIITCCIGGAGIVDPAGCYSEFFVVLALHVFLFLLLVWLRPFIVPFKTLSNGVNDLSIAIGGFILMSCVLSDEKAQNLASQLEMGSKFCVVTGSVIGAFLITVAVCRLGILTFYCRGKVMTQSRLEKLLGRRYFESRQKQFGSKGEENKKTLAERHGDWDQELAPIKKSEARPDPLGIRNIAFDKGFVFPRRLDSLAHEELARMKTNNNIHDNNYRRGTKTSRNNNNNNSYQFLRSHHDHDVVLPRSYRQSSVPSKRNTEENPFAVERTPSGFLRHLL